jgi:methylated-DNA-[protein]-cysteine S-methyltransferase
MAEHGFTLFDTALGWCAVAWTARGVCGVRLPEVDAERTREAMRRRFPHAEEGAPPPAVARACEGITALLAGTPSPLLDVELDLDGVGEFERAVYAATRAIPPGETRSYGQIAAAVGEPGAAQAVGRALGRNPVPVLVACHRVLAADGRLHGFSAPGGLETKLRMLAIEHALGGGQPALFDDPETFSLKLR